MNSNVLIPKLPYNLRLWRKVCMTIAQLSLFSPALQYTCLKYGGIRFKDKCFIGSKALLNIFKPNRNRVSLPVVLIFLSNF